MIRALLAVLACALAVPARAQDPGDAADPRPWVHVSTTVVAADEMIDTWRDVETGRFGLTSTRVTLAAPASGGPLVPRELATTWTSHGGAVTHTATSNKGSEHASAFLEDHRATVEAMLASFAPDAAARVAQARIRPAPSAAKPSRAR